jgi:gamma-glutamyltranspeptidase
MVVRMADGTSKSFNFREAAPANATRDMYKGITHRLS